MRKLQAGTSVLAALVFVAIFVLFISGYRIAQQSSGTQSASAAAALDATPHCAAGDVYSVDMSSGAGRVSGLHCLKSDPKNPTASSPGPDSARVECLAAVPGKCAVQYCPPSSYLTQSGACFRIAACDPGDDLCLNSQVKNASQPAQAASIIAAQLLSDKGATAAHSSGSSEPVPLAANLSDSGRVAVTDVIGETADAAHENNLDDAAIRNVAQAIGSVQAQAKSTGPAAQISCQPKIAEGGMQVAIAYGCANSVSSEGGGFSTGGRAWGATEVSLPEDLPNGTMTYAITCTDGHKKASASCDVAVQKPFALLTTEADQDGNAALAWITRGMSACMLAAPDHADLAAQFDNPVTQSGAITAKIPSGTRIALQCTTVGGEPKEISSIVR